jgi:hypothetical protein
MAIGQLVGGVALVVGGATGEFFGGALSSTGIGAAVGVPAMVVSTAALVGGLGNIAAGIRTLATTGSGGGSGGPKGQVHHVATNKNYVSTKQGGPWSPKFEEMFKKAGMTLEDAENMVKVPGHHGPHPEAYHQAVLDRLQDATDGLSGDAYTTAFRAELARLRAEAATQGTKLNNLLTQ